MPNDRKNFLEGLKAPETSETPSVRAPFSDRDVYTCLKLMGDTNKVHEFLLSAKKQEVDGPKISTEMSANYFYVICYELGRAEYEFREGTIDRTEFNNKINQVCKSHYLDFNYLIEITKKIDSLERKPSQNESAKLAQEVETTIIEIRKAEQEKE